MRTASLLLQRMECSEPGPADEIEPRVWLCSWCGEEPGDCECAA